MISSFSLAFAEQRVLQTSTRSDRRRLWRSPSALRRAAIAYLIGAGWTTLEPLWSRADRARVKRYRKMLRIVRILRRHCNLSDLSVAMEAGTTEALVRFTRQYTGMQPSLISF